MKKHLALIAASMFFGTMALNATATYKDGTENGHDYVDLGLTSGTLWATANIGGTNPEDYGSYFAWGETTPQTDKKYYWETYKYSNGDQSNLTKYCNDSNYGDGGYTDTKTRLDTTDDAANANWSGRWVTPTASQQNELINECYLVWTSNYNSSNTAGFIVYKAKSASDKGVKIISGLTPSSSYSLTDAHIFLPASGYCSDGSVQNANESADYWSSTMCQDAPYDALSIALKSTYISGNTKDGRFYGQPVRAVFNIIYALTVSSNNDEYGTVSGTGKYNKGSNAEITATANEGYKFIKWSDGNTETSRTIILTSDSAVTAYFERYYPEYSDGTENGHDYVDLGLTSKTLWATSNLGTTEPAESGEYYAWGETSAKKYDEYTWEKYKHANGSEDKLTKYCNSSEHGNDGYTDSKTVLESEDDAAAGNWEGKWVMPTDEQIQELRKECYWVWTEDYNASSKPGYIVYKAKTAKDKGVKVCSGETADASYSLTDAHIFLPTAGYIYNGSTTHEECGTYWTSSLYTGNAQYSSANYFDSGSIKNNYIYRNCGLTIRAVCPTTYTLALTANKSVYGTASGSGIYSAGTEIEITATPNEMCEFVKWSDGNTNETRTIKLDSDSALTAIFKVQTYKDGSEEGHEYVDLGLTSETLWATANMGATNPEEYGEYYAWGETTPQSGGEYTWASYKYSNGAYNTITKYCNNASYGYNKYTDTLTVLEAGDDAAAANWGGKWKMPTTAMQNELINECYCVWTKDYNTTGIAGFIIYKAKSASDKGVKVYSGSTESKSYSLLDAHIFMPAAGDIRSGKMYDKGTYGYYDSSSLYEASTAHGMYFSADVMSDEGSGMRMNGRSIRAVMSKSEATRVNEKTSDNAQQSVKKILKDGVVYIIKGENVYGLDGNKVK